MTIHKDNGMKRDLNVDIAKAIGIMLVVLAHTTNLEHIHNIIYFFHMPLFFFLSGMTIKYSIEKDYKDYIKKKIKRIIVPYIFFSIIIFIYWLFIERKIRNQMNISALENFINIFLCKADGNLYAYNIAMWFLPCLFISEQISYLLIKKIKNIKIRVMISLLIFAVGIALANNKIYLVYTIETSFVAQFFINIGYIFDELKQKGTMIIRIIFTMLAVLGIGVCIFKKNNIDMLGHIYGNPLLFVVGAISGIYLTYEATTLFTKSSIILYFGMNSLIIMILHEPVKRIIIKLFSIVLKRPEAIVRGNLLYSIGIVAIIFLLIVPVINCMNRFCPELVGKNRR